MQEDVTTLRDVALTLLLGAAVLVSGCGGDKAPAPPVPADSAVADAAAPSSAPAPVAGATAEAPKAAPESALLAPTDKTWTPEAMEELLAPVALYPDIVLGQVLIASANPQEVLDAGNWLLQNQTLKADPLEEAAKKAGFTPPIRGLMQSPEVVDTMCTQMGWTSELGQAYVNDQAGVLEAVQRLRAQAKDAGNLKSSEQMKVATEVQDGQQVITVSPPNPQVVYVPQYNPVTVYAPAPAATTTVAPAATTVTEGHSTGTLVATGLLSFGAGILVANVLDDDDDDWNHPNYYGAPMPYYPPYPYRPNYGGGYYPSHGYNRPPGYQNGFNNNNVVINQNNNYWNKYDKNNINNRPKADSPITAAKGNRPELNSLNTKDQDRARRQAPAQADSWKNQGSYAGAKKDGARPGAAKPTAGAMPKLQGSYAGAKTPGVTGSYAGAKTSGARAPVASAKPAGSANRQASPGASRPASQPRTASADRGRAASNASRPASRPASARPNTDRSGMSGVNHGGAERKASQRGKQSMPGGAPSGAKGGGNGGGRRGR